MKRRGTLLIRIGELKVLLRRVFIFILFLAGFFFFLVSRIGSFIFYYVYKGGVKVNRPVM